MNERLFVQHPQGWNRPRKLLEATRKQYFRTPISLNSYDAAKDYRRSILLGLHFGPVFGLLAGSANRYAQQGRARKV